MIVLDDLEKQMFDLFPLVRFVLHLEELFHFVIAKADFAFRWVISVDETQQSSRVLVVSVDLLWWVQWRER